MILEKVAIIAYTLLIEPVWNRNLQLGRLCVSPCELLIEPVWNRNPLMDYAVHVLYSSFNRTSLESKQHCETHSQYLPPLLIEPVWNRNSSAAFHPSTGCILLIEPVWNRN